MTKSGRWALAGLVVSTLAVFGAAVVRHRRGPQAAATPARAVLRCAQCHAEIARTYAHVGMARSFQPVTVPDPPLPPGPIHHARSGRYYEVLRRGDRLVQRRYERSPDAEQVNAFEMEATHVVGSGNHARTYFHLTGAGELVELPLTWYSQENRWYLSPGFDRSSPPDFTRRADESCLFCHNGYPRSGAMANGIDCERCHGDGSRHAELASRGGTADQLRAAIVNPARLPSALQMDVCMQCHLETTSQELPQIIRRFDRGVFSFRPGEPLGSYIVHFDAASGRDRFEIVNQAYRLRQSACFRTSAGRLTCGTCHNPHDVPRGAAAVTWYRSKCTSCHPSVKAAGHPSLAAADCASCHMPKRRAEDAVHVIMTDHLITRRPPRGSIEPPSMEQERSFPGALSVYYPELSAADRDLYLGLALIVGGRDRRAGISLLERSAAAQSNSKAIAVLAEGRLAEHDAAGAVRDFQRALALGAQSARVHYNFAQALDAAGQPAEAGREFEEALRIDAHFPEAHYAYANHLLKMQDPAAAMRQYEAAIQGRPVYAEAQNNLGNVLAGLKEIASARSHFEEALRIDPGFAEAHENEARVLAEQGEAASALEHSRRAVELKPDSPSAHYNLGQLLQFNSEAAAISEYRAALRLRPDFVAAHMALGSTLGNAGKLDAAIDEFRAALRIEPENALARKNLDVALSARGH